MSEIFDKKVYDLDGTTSNGGAPPGMADTQTYASDSDSEGSGEVFHFKPWMPLLGMCIFMLFGGAFMGHYFVIQPVIPLGRDNFISDMGFFGWFFQGPALESVTVADFFAGGLAAASVILTDLFLHFFLIVGYLDRPEYFLNQPTLKLKSRMILCCYVGTLLIESGALYMRMSMNDQILADPDNPLRSFQIHGLGELFGYSALIIFLNGVFAFLTILLVDAIKKGGKK